MMNRKINSMTVVLLLSVLCTFVYGADSLQKLCRDLVLASGGSSVVKGTDGWLFLREEVEHLGAGAFWGAEAKTASRTKNSDFADPVPAIVEYNRLLAEKGITLYLMPVPPKALVYGDRLAPGLQSQIIDEDVELYARFYETLAGSGVRTIDLLPELLANRDTMDVYCRTDTHFSPAGMELFADAAAEAVRGESWYKTMKQHEYIRTPQKISIVGDLGRMAGSHASGEDLDITVIGNKGDDTLLESDEKSPVILLGDSHTLVFQAGNDLHAKGAGLFDHLSAGLGFPVDLLGVRGSGVTPARIKLFQRSKKDTSYLEGKKVVIWCFAARDFTGTGGWRNIPVAP